MHKLNKKDEKINKEIIARNVKCIKENKKLNTIIYYKNKKT